MAEALFSLEIISIDLVSSQHLSTGDGIASTLKAQVQVRVRPDAAHIKLAVDQLLRKSQEEQKRLIQAVMEGHLRHIIGQVTCGELFRDTPRVGEQLITSATPDLEKVGMMAV